MKEQDLPRQTFDPEIIFGDESPAVDHVHTIMPPKHPEAPDTHSVLNPKKRRVQKPK